MPSHPSAPPRASFIRAAAPSYRWRVLRAGPLRLDGGSMFGVVPRVLWSRMIEPDEQGRILLGHNCLLLEREPHGAEREGRKNAAPQPRRVLIESGSGDKFDAKSRAIFGLTDESIESALAREVVRREEIDDVIVSHLHFDHAGGLTRRCRPGESPDWTPAGADPSNTGVKLSFPNATVFVQRQEWEDASANRSVMTRTYLKENLEPLRDRVRLIDAPPPFPPGYRPEKDESPTESLSARSVEILPGIFVFRVPGHTWGQQAIGFTDGRGRIVVFTADLLPTIHHAGSAYNMAYDVEPYISTVTRRWLLEEAVKGEWLLVLDHEPRTPVCRASRDGKGWYRLEPEECA